MNKKIAKLLFVIYIFILLYLTIFSRTMMIFHYTEEQILNSYLNIHNWMLFDTIHLFIKAQDNQLFAVNIIGNIVVFIPLTLLSCLIYDKWYSNVFITLLLTWVIEVSQLLLICGSFDIDDVFLNLLGGIVGIIIFKTITYFAKRKRCASL